MRAHRSLRPIGPTLRPLSLRAGSGPGGSSQPPADRAYTPVGERLEIHNTIIIED
jgi:hypothetical protein